MIARPVLPRRIFSFGVPAAVFCVFLAGGELCADPDGNSHRKKKTKKPYDSMPHSKS
jgi:hypothetical protein